MVSPVVSRIPHWGTVKNTADTKESMSEFWTEGKKMAHGLSV